MTLHEMGCNLFVELLCVCFVRNEMNDQCHDSYLRNDCIGWHYITLPPTNQAKPVIHNVMSIIWCLCNIIIMITLYYHSSLVGLIIYCAMCEIVSCSKAKGLGCLFLFIHSSIHWISQLQSHYTLNLSLCHYLPLHSFILYHMYLDIRILIQSLTLLCLHHKQTHT